MKKLATKIFVSLYDAIKKEEPVEVCIGKIELILKGFDEIVKKPVLVLDEKGEPVNQ